jgi:hypothetical protein
MGVSMKTTFLLLAFGLAALFALLTSARGHSSPFNLRQLILSAGAALVGLFLVPVALTLFFWAQGALGPFFYGTIHHNLVPGMGHWGKSHWRFFLFPLMLPPLWWGGQIIFHHAPRATLGTRRVFVFFLAGFYISALESYWPLLQWQDFLPFYPLFALLLTPLILKTPSFAISGLSGINRPVRPFVKALIPVVIVLLEISLLLANKHHYPQRETVLLSEVLHLTRRSDPVIDTKGETIFRQRSCYYVFEKVTISRIERKMIPDDIPERLIATRTCVAGPDRDKFPRRTRQFLQENYLRVGRLRVVGQFLVPPTAGELHPISFEVRIPAHYALVAERGAVKGSLDGAPYVGPRFLALGHHEFRPSCQAGTLALVWAQAVERGFLPFPQRS